MFTQKRIIYTRIDSIIYYYIFSFIFVQNFFAYPRGGRAMVSYGLFYHITPSLFCCFIISKHIHDITKKYSRLLLCKFLFLAIFVSMTHASKYILSCGQYNSQTEKKLTEYGLKNVLLSNYNSIKIQDYS